MNDSSQSPHASGSFSQDAKDQPTFDAHVPEDFVPLRLALLPGGMAVELTKAEVTLGRHSNSDVRLALPDVSRRHCRFIFVDANWHVIDLNSLNGTFVNGERVQQVQLKNNDRLRIGGFTFEISIAPSPSIAGSTPNPNSEKRLAS